MTSDRSRGPAYKAIVLGAGAAGMFCAAHAALGGGRVLVLDHAKAPGEKIRISGGGRCNFTNIRAAPENFLSQNPHFAKSALARYTPQDFVDLVERRGVPYHEKKLGQLFCDNRSSDIIDLLLSEMAAAGAELRLRATIADVAADPTGGWRVTVEDETGRRTLDTETVVVATGGKAIPKMGATGFALQLAERYGLGVVETRPALVPLTFSGALLERLRALSGVAVEGAARAGEGAREGAFEEALLFTHRGLSGPAILQVSSFWREGRPVTLSLAPSADVSAVLAEARGRAPKRTVAAVLGGLLPKRLAQAIADELKLTGPIGACSDAALRRLQERIGAWRVTPSGSEGYRTAEVMLGGVDTADLDSRTLEARRAPGLYFIGEAVDVTGWLGGYNFQWAWASGYAAGVAIAAR